METFESLNPFLPLATQRATYNQLRQAKRSEQTQIGE
jgi:hypothetical protein